MIHDFVKRVAQQIAVREFGASREEISDAKLALSNNWKTYWGVQELSPRDAFGKLAQIAQQEISDEPSTIMGPQNPENIIDLLSEMLDIVSDPNKLKIEGINRNSQVEDVIEHIATRLGELALSTKMLFSAYPHRDPTLLQMVGDDPYCQPTTPRIAIKYYKEIAIRVIKQILIRSSESLASEAYRSALIPLIKELEIEPNLLKK
jgi:hypothetical protein